MTVAPTKSEVISYAGKLENGIGLFVNAVESGSYSGVIKGIAHNLQTFAGGLAISKALLEGSEPGADKNAIATGTIWGVMFAGTVTVAASPVLLAFGLPGALALTVLEIAAFDQGYIAGYNSAANIDGTPTIPPTLSMEKSTINVDGQPVNLTPGMAVTVEVKTGKRRVIEYIASPLMRYKQESLRER